MFGAVFLCRYSPALGAAGCPSSKDFFNLPLGQTSVLHGRGKAVQVHPTGGAQPYASSIVSGFKLKSADPNSSLAL